MNKIWAITKKELGAYFKSPIAYVILVVTISIFNIFFYVIIDENREATLRDVFKVMEFMFIFIVPLLTMKVFAEEKSTGTIEFLMTTPTTNTTIVFGKYLGALSFFSCMIALTLPYYFIIEYFGAPDRLAVLTGYFGVWLEGALFISIGLMISSWTKSQVAAAISSYVVLFLLYFTTGLVRYVPETIKVGVLYLSTLSHMENFAAGLISSTDIIYYLSGILFCLMLTRLGIENRLWR